MRRFRVELRPRKRPGTPSPGELPLARPPQPQPARMPEGMPCRVAVYAGAPAHTNHSWALRVAAIGHDALLRARAARHTSTQDARPHRPWHHSGPMAAGPSPRRLSARGGPRPPPARSLRDDRASGQHTPRPPGREAAPPSPPRPSTTQPLGATTRCHKRRGAAAGTFGRGRLPPPSATPPRGLAQWRGGAASGQKGGEGDPRPSQGGGWKSHPAQAPRWRESKVGCMGGPALPP